MRLLEIADNMLGFVIKQPIHVTLRQLRVVQIGLVVSSQMMLWEIIRSLKNLDPTQAAMAFGAISAALIAQIWGAVSSIHKGTGKDDE